MSIISSRIRRLAAVVAAALAFSGAAHAEGVEKFADTTRIVSIGGSLTEIVYALGAEKMLVARDQTSNFPESVKSLPDVGYMRRLAPEGVLSVNPSGILLLEGSGPQSTIEVLKKASVPMVTVPEKHSRENIIEKIEIVGKALGLEDKARELAAKVDGDLDAAEKAAAGKSPRKRVIFIMSAQGGRILASGTDTAADGIIKLAGGVNAIDAYKGYKQLTDEAIEASAPDMILTMNAGRHSVTSEELLKNPALAATPAARNGKIVQMDAMYLLGFGPRTGAAIRDLSTTLYGESAGH